MEIRETSLERWQRAAQRALASDLPHGLRRRGATVLVPSKTERGVTYHVQLAAGRVGACDCPAGLHNRPCAHRAAVALRLYEQRIGARVTAVRVTPALVAAYIRPA